MACRTLQLTTGGDARLYRTVGHEHPGPPVALKRTLTACNLPLSFAAFLLVLLERGDLYSAIRNSRNDKNPKLTRIGADRADSADGTATDPPHRPDLPNSLPSASRSGFAFFIVVKCS